MNIKLFHCIVRGHRSKTRNTRCNSGIQKRLGLMKENYPDIENVDINEQKIENLESGVIGDNYTYDSKKRNEKNIGIIEFKNVERKFFKKEILPNLLTWSEKEQIRYLNNSDPITWSPEKISESFPATSDIVKKLIKSQWRPMSSDRIARHDKSVSENWQAIENGLVNIPDYFKVHIKKFVSRKNTANLNTPDKSLEKVDYSLNSTSSEFLNIIKTYKNKCEENRHHGENYSENLKSTNRSETFVLNQKDSVPLKHKYYTLHLLREELKSHTPSMNINNREGETNFVDRECKPHITTELVHSKYPIPQTHINSNVRVKSLPNVECNEEIALKIRLPKEKKIKSKTQVYKVKDCYYDHQGEFLYKVPGME